MQPRGVVVALRAEFDHGGGQMAHGAEQGRGVEGAEADARQTVEAEALQVDHALARVGEAQAVVAHGGVGGAEAAHAHRFQTARSAIVAQVDAGKALEGVAHVGDAALEHGGRVEMLQRSG